MSQRKLIVPVQCCCSPECQGIEALIQWDAVQAHEHGYLQQCLLTTLCILDAGFLADLIQGSQGPSGSAGVALELSFSAAGS